MKRLTSLTSGVTSPCFSNDNNLVVCTASGYIIEFTDKKNYDNQKILYEIDGIPNCIVFDENNNEAVICDTSSGNLYISDINNDENDNKINNNNNNNDNLTSTILQKPSILCNEYEGELLKGPNTCIIDSKGRKFFTDSGPFGETSLENNNGSLFLINKSGILRRIAYKCLSNPTDLVLSNDENCLYLCEMFKNQIIRYVEINNKGNKKSGIFHSNIFYRFNGGVGPTGITIDNDDNLYILRYEYKYLNNPGYLTIIDSKGKLINEFKINKKYSQLTGIIYRNNTLYITSLNSIFSINVLQLFKNTNKINEIELELI